MTWNVFLAIVPVALAIVLFRQDVRPNAVWWIGFAAFLAFLPNAPYVLTDVVHLLDDIRTARSDLQIAVVYAPVYLALFAVGVSAYVLSLERFRRHVASRLPGWRWWALEAALHMACAAGIYLGRVVRLNSWEILTRPGSVVGATDNLLAPFPLSVIAFLVAVLVLVTLATRVVLHSVTSSIRGWFGRTA